jgi:hypothetical protein
MKVALLLPMQGKEVTHTRNVSREWDVLCFTESYRLALSTQT